MHHCLLTESFPKRSLIDRYHQVGPSVELTYSWAGEIPVGNSLIVGCFWQGREMHFPIAGQDLLLNNRMWSNTAKQWLPANDCAHAALFHKDTLGPVCFNLFDWLLFEADFDFTCLFNSCTSFFSLYSQECHSAVLIYMPLQHFPHDFMYHIYFS